MGSHRPTLRDVLRLLADGESGRVANEAYVAAKNALEAERRAQFAGFDVPAEWPWPASAVFHEHSKQTQASWCGVDPDEIEAHTLTLDYRRYPAAAKVALPAARPLALSLADALRARRSVREFSGAAVSLDAIATLLALGCGVQRSVNGDGARVPARSAPSPGALYPIEVYPLVLRATGLASGLYHYAPLEHELAFLRAVSADETLALNRPLLQPADASLVVVLAARFERVQKKYGERGYRFALLEAGHIAQNVSLLAAALGLDAVCMGGFFDEPMNQLLQLDGVREAAVYSVVLGGPGRQQM